MFNSKKSAIAMKDEEIKSLRKDIEALNSLLKEKEEQYSDLEAVYNFMKDIYESQLNDVIDAKNAQNDAEKQVDRLRDLNRILIAENEKLREGLDAISKSCTAISKSCTEYINYDGSEAIYGEDAHCKEVDDDNYDKYYNFNFEDGSYDDESVSFDDDDDEDDFWDCDDPEEAIHDELFERNEDDDDDDYRDDDDYCYSTNIDKLVEENEDEEEAEEELTQEDYIIKSIGNIVECIGDIFDGKSDEEVIEKIDFATLCRAIIG